MSLWESLFAHLQQPVAQILLTRNDIADVCKRPAAMLVGLANEPPADTISECAKYVHGASEHGSYTHCQRERYSSCLCTSREKISCTTPLLIALQEIRQIEKFGDNDTLSAITAAMVQADYLFLMTDVDCLYDKNPRTHPDAQAIEVVEDVSSLEADVSSAGSSLGTGGMSTKIVAARLATSAGVTTVITRSSNPGNILAIVNHVQAHKAAEVLSSDFSSTSATPAENTLLSGSMSSLPVDALPAPPLHTRFVPDPLPIRDRSFWLLHGLAAHGTLYIDQGAHRALASKAGLFPAGIVDVEGQFAQQEAVRLVVVTRNPPACSAVAQESSGVGGGGGGGVPVDVAVEPVEVGRALVNYSAAEIMRIKGMRSTDIGGVLGYADSEYVALRENVSLTKREKSRPVTPSAHPTGTAGQPL